MKYRKEFNDIAGRLAERGATNRTVAAALGVHEETVRRWRQKYPEFGQALDNSKVRADLDVASSLFRQAIGYTYESQEARVVKTSDGGEEVVVTTVVKYVPPRPAAAIFWLRNRQPSLWREDNGSKTQ